VIGVVASVLAASLLGSPHCAAMCGPFACLYGGQTAERQAWAPHLAYNLGRLGSYLALGMLAGLAGAGLNQLGLLAGLPRAAGIVAGALMIAWGGMTMAAALGTRVPGASPPAAFHRLLTRVITRFQAHPPTLRALALGLLTTLLPCGWLYAFVATAASTGTPLHGILVMAAFWAGTLPMMAAIGIAAQRGFGPLRRRLPVVTAAVLVVLGLLTIGGRLAPRTIPLPGPDAHAGH